MLKYIFEEMQKTRSPVQLIDEAAAEQKPHAHGTPVNDHQIVSMHEKIEEMQKEQQKGSELMRK